MSQVTISITRTVSVHTPNKEVVQRQKIRKTVRKTTPKRVRLNLKPNNLTVKQIKEMLQQHGASATGDKDELVARLRREIHKAPNVRHFLVKLSCESLKDLLCAHAASCAGIKRELIARACRLVVS